MSYRWMALALLLAAPGTALAKDARPSLEQRVQRMEDESAIRRILIEYGADLDAKDYHAYAALFAHDGVWQGGFGTFTGPAAIEKMLVDNLGASEPGFVNKANFHMLTNPIIEIDGDRAHVTSKYLFWTSTDGKPTPLLAGRYVDDFVRENGQWKIARRATWGAIPSRDPNAPRVAGGGPAAAPLALSTEQRLRRAEDQLAIMRVITDYAARCARLRRLCRAVRQRRHLADRPDRPPRPGRDQGDADRSLRPDPTGVCQRPELSPRLQHRSRRRRRPRQGSLAPPDDHARAGRPPAADARRLLRRRVRPRERPVEDPPPRRPSGDADGGGVDEGDGGAAGEVRGCSRDQTPFRRDARSRCYLRVHNRRSG
ncbi:MAG: nuclear transport factor 2 family protein [Croceibacterium sp.]